MVLCTSSNKSCLLTGPIYDFMNIHGYNRIQQHFIRELNKISHLNLRQGFSLSAFIAKRLTYMHRLCLTMGR